MTPPVKHPMFAITRFDNEGNEVDGDELFSATMVSATVNAVRRALESFVTEGESVAVALTYMTRDEAEAEAETEIDDIDVDAEPDDETSIAPDPPAVPIGA